MIGKIMAIVGAFYLVGRILKPKKPAPWQIDRHEGRPPRNWKKLCSRHVVELRPIVALLDSRNCDECKKEKRRK